MTRDQARRGAQLNHIEHHLDGVEAELRSLGLHPDLGGILGQLRTLVRNLVRAQRRG